MSFYKMEERRYNEMLQQIHQQIISYHKSTNTKLSIIEEKLESLVHELRGNSFVKCEMEQEEFVKPFAQSTPEIDSEELSADSLTHLNLRFPKYDSEKSPTDSVDDYEGPPVFDEDPNKEDHDLEEQKIILEALGIQEVQAKGPQTPIIALELFDESSKKEEVNEESELAEKYAVQGCSTTYFLVEGDHKPDYGQRTKNGMVPWIKKKVRPDIYTITTAYDLYQHNRDTSLEIMMFDSSHDWGGDNQAACDNQAASELIKTEVEPILEQYRPMISSIKFYEITLGTAALQFTGVFIIVAGCVDGIMMEMEMQWEGTRVSVELPVQVNDIAFNGVLRLTFKPLVEELPCLGAASFSLRLKNKLDFTLKVISGDISAIPGISVDLVVVIVSATCGVVLTLLDNLYLKSSHSIFFNSLRTRGFKLDFKLAEDPNLTLQRYGQYWDGALILFSPTTNRFGGSLNLVATLDFADSGHEVIVAADEDATNLIRNIAAECGIDFDEDFSTMVIDHISYAISEMDGNQTLIAADDSIQSDVMLESARIEAPVLFKRVRHSLNPANRLVLKVLSGSSSSYPANPKQKLSTPPALTRSIISLVSIVHARTNARILFSGSLDLFSNSFFKSSASMGNLQLCGYDAFPLCSTSPAPWPERSKSQGNKLSTEDIILIAVRDLLVVLLLLCNILACCLFGKRIESSTKDGKAATRAGPKSGDRRVPSTASEVETGGNGGKLVHFDRPIVFTAEDLLCATVEIMGKSTYGIVYKGALEDGSQVAVKSLREKLTKNQEEFEMEVNRSGKIRNPNLLAMRTYYLGPKGEKLMAFDYMPKGKSGRPEIDKSKRPEYQEGSRKSVTIYIYDPGGNFSYPQGILLSVSTGLQKLTQQEVGRSKSNHEDMVDFQGGRIVRIALEDQYLLVVYAKVGSIGATTAVSQAKRCDDMSADLESKRIKLCMGKECCYTSLSRIHIY